MPSDAQALLLQVSADIRGLEKQMARAQGVVDKGSRGMEKRAQQAATSLERFFGKTDPAKALDKVFDSTRFKVLDSGVAKIGLMGSALESLGPAGLLAAAGIGAVAAAFAGARQAAAFADDISDTAKRLHVTTDALQEYRYAIRAAGGEEKGADEALENFSTNLGLAREGLTKAQRGFLALGFTKPQIQSMSDADQALRAVTERIQGLSNTDKDAVIRQLGLEGLKPLLEDGVAEMDRLRAEAHKVGIVMDADLVKRGGELNDQFETVSKVIDVQLKSALVDLGPILIKLLGFMAQLASDAANVADAFRDIEHKRTQSLERQRTAFIVRQNKGGPIAALTQAHDRKRIGEITAELNSRAKENAAPPVTPTRALVPKASGGSHHTPHDSTAQRSSQVEAQVETAQRDVLRALLSLTENTAARASLQKQILDHETAADQAKTAGEIAAIEADKGLTAAKKAELIAALKSVELGKGIAAGLQKQAIDREAAEAASRQALELTQQGLEGEAELLRQRQGLATSSKEQQAIALSLVDLGYQREKAELEALIATQKAAGADTRLAELKLRQLDAQQPGRREEAARTGSEAARQVGGIVEGIQKKGNLAEDAAAMYAEIDRLRQADQISESEAAQARAEVNARYNEQRLADAQSFFGNLATLTQSSNKTLAGIGKAAAIAQATIDGILAVQKALASAPPPFSFALAAAAGVAAAVNVGKIAAMADGGTVRGPGGPREDRVPILASNGEFVVNAAAAQKNLALLHAINAGGAPRFAAGGLVGGPRLSGGRPVVEVRQAHFHLVSPVMTQDLLDQMQAISARDSSTAYSRARRDTLGDVGRQRYSQDLNA